MQKRSFFAVTFISPMVSVSCFGRLFGARISSICCSRIHASCNFIISPCTLKEMSERGKRIIQSDYFLPVAKLCLLLLYYINKTLRQTSVTGGAIIVAVIIAIIATINSFYSSKSLVFVIPIASFLQAFKAFLGHAHLIEYSCQVCYCHAHSLSSAHAECVPCLFLIIHIFC